MPATETKMKRGEKTRLVREYLQQNPDASKKEVMEKFDISDAMFYNTRKMLAGKKTISKRVIETKKPKQKTNVQSSAPLLSLNVGNGITLSMTDGTNTVGRIELTREGISFQSCAEGNFPTLLTWDNFCSLQKSGLLDK